MINIVFGRPIHSLRIFFKKQNKHKNLLFKYLYIYIASEIIRTREAEIVERGDSWKDVIILFRDISPGNMLILARGGWESGVSLGRGPQLKTKKPANTWHLDEMDSQLDAWGTSSQK